MRSPLLATCALFTLAACSNESGSRATPSPGSGNRVTNSSEGTVDLGREPYHAGSTSGSGSVAGRVTADLPLPTDTSGGRATSSEPACAKSQAMRAQPRGKPTNGVGNAIVWIANPKAGKPLPIERRYELLSEDCDLDPAIQAGVTGSTFNVGNDDRVLHRLVFVRMGTHDTLTVMPFFNAGQLVASERLAKSSGIVEVQCLHHRWMHGYVAVFEHPYFAVTKPDGSFRIDSLPPGTYKAMVWRAGLAKPVQQDVQVTAGGAAKVDVALK
jgi:hypothetical protein